MLQTTNCIFLQGVIAEHHLFFPSFHQWCPRKDQTLPGISQASRLFSSPWHLNTFGIIWYCILCQSWTWSCICLFFADIIWDLSCNIYLFWITVLQLSLERTFPIRTQTVADIKIHTCCLLFCFWTFVLIHNVVYSWSWWNYIHLSPFFLPHECVETPNQIQNWVNGCEGLCAIRVENTRSQSNKSRQLFQVTKQNKSPNQLE